MLLQDERYPEVAVLEAAVQRQLTIPERRSICIASKVFGDNHFNIKLSAIFPLSSSRQGK